MILQDSSNNLLDDFPLALLVFIVITIVIVLRFKKLVIDKALERSKEFELVGGFRTVITEERFHADLVEVGILVVLVLPVASGWPKSAIRRRKEGHTKQLASGETWKRI